MHRYVSQLSCTWLSVVILFFTCQHASHCICVSVSSSHLFRWAAGPGSSLASRLAFDREELYNVSRPIVEV